MDHCFVLMGKIIENNFTNFMEMAFKAEIQFSSTFSANVKEPIDVFVLSVDILLFTHIRDNEKNNFKGL